MDSAMMTATTRSKARYQRAAAVLPKITLGPAEAEALAAEKARTGERTTELIRRLIRETKPA